MSSKTYPPLPASPVIGSIKPNGVLNTITNPNEYVADLITQHLKKNRIHNMRFTLYNTTLEHEYYGKERVSVEALHKIFRSFVMTIRNIYKVSNRKFGTQYYKNIAGYQIDVSYLEDKDDECKVFCRVNINRIVSN